MNATQLQKQCLLICSKFCQTGYSYHFGIVWAIINYFRPATLDSLIITEYSCSKHTVRWMNHMHISLGDVIFALKSLTHEIVAIDSIWQCLESLEEELSNIPSWWLVYSLKYTVNNIQMIHVHDEHKRESLLVIWHWGEKKLYLRHVSESSIL